MGATTKSDARGLVILETTMLIYNYLSDGYNFL